MRIRNPLDRDKHPGSATLPFTILLSFFLYRFDVFGQIFMSDKKNHSDTVIDIGHLENSL